MALLLFAGAARAADCVVTVTGDDPAAPPPGSLRACLDFANATAGRDRISFDPQVFSPGVIALAGALPALTDSAGLELVGPSAADVIVDGTNVPGVTGINVQSSGNEVRNLTLQRFTGTGWGSGTAVLLRPGTRDNLLGGLIIASNQGGGVILEGDNAGTVLEDSEIRDNAFAGLRSVSNDQGCPGRIVIRRNHFHDNNGDPTTDDVMLSFTTCADVLDNRFERNPYFAIRLSAASTAQVQILGNVFVEAGIGVFGGSHQNLIAFNEIVQAPTHGIVMGDPNGSNQNVIAGNVIRGAAMSGVNIYGAAHDAVIVHNTFYGNGGPGLIASGSTGLVVQNNLFVGNGSGIGAAVEPTWTVSHNGFFQNAAGPCVGGCAVGETAILEDPGLKGPPDDLTLLGCDGGAVNAGADLEGLQPDLTPPTDGLRFYGPAPDLGAKESACGEPPAGADGGQPAVDGGIPGRAPWALEVGCGCRSEGGAPWTLGILLLVLAPRRGRRPVSPGT